MEKETLFKKGISAVDAIALFRFYASEATEMVGGVRHPVNSEYLEQYRIMEKWLKEASSQYELINDTPER